MPYSFFDEFVKGLKNISHGGSTVRRGFRNPFLTEKERERNETRELYQEVKREFDASPYANPDAIDEFTFNVIVEACDRAGITPAIPLGEALWSTVRGLLISEGSIFGFPEIDPDAELTLEEGVALREHLHRKCRFLSDHERLLDIWREKVIRIFEGILGYVPASVLAESEDGEQRPSSFTTPLIDLCQSPAEVIERTMLTMFDNDVVNARLFDGLREQLDRNALIASGISPERRHDTSRSITLPTAVRKKSNTELVDTYLVGTPFAELFLNRFPLAIPFPVRFEHTHIVGGTGHGKTQLLQLLIHQDIFSAVRDGRSVVVIDSQGDLIRTISHLRYFAPDLPDSITDRLLIIDPNDVEYPVCLNMFDWNRERLRTFRPVDREKILNGTVELYEYLFGALLGAELTQRQGLIFKYLARLMMEIPDATIHTLRELMENSERFRPYLEKLPPTARSFFETRFSDRSFSETKKQILTRLWGVLSNAVFDRMFSHPKNKVDLFEATNSGKIILINTAKELLKQDGSAIFGRFFIALLAQATIQRATLQPHERRPTFIYIDEAQDYFDQNIDHLLTQARKYRLGMALAHQNLDQLSAGLRASIMANTSIKFAGGVSAKDASTFAAEMHSDPDFIHDMRKKPTETQFACYVRNLTPQAVEVSVPLGSVEPFASLSDEDFGTILDTNRARYCAPAAEIDALQLETTRRQEPGEPSRTKAQPPRQAPSSKSPPVASPETSSERPRPTQPPEESASEALSPAEIERAENILAPATTEYSQQGPLKSKEARPSGEPPPMGRGGQQHKYLQQLIKQAAEERGFRATIEEPILDGEGSVDVSLSQGERRIACEVSVTTARDQELGNVEKCLAAGYDEVILVSSTERQLASLRKFIVPQLEEEAVPRVHFLAPEEVITRLDEVAATAAVTETTSRGYKVRVTKRLVGEEEAKARRQAIAGVIARSLMRRKDEP